MKPLIIFLVISCGIFSRLIPHLPNFSPEIVFALYLGMKSQKSWVYCYVLLMAVTSDTLISWQHSNFTIFGNWSLFTYSALLIISQCGILIKYKGFGLIFLGSTCVATLFYWLWTNLGTWLMTEIYPHSIAGFVMCYWLALPFLAISLVSSVIWCAIIIAGERYMHAEILEIQS